MKKVKISKLPNDGTLRESDGVKCWQLNGIYHREDGPAIELANGDKKIVKTGLKDFQKIEILSGLSVTDEIIKPK